jgi:uncharacterized membrane protein
MKFNWKLEIPQLVMLGIIAVTSAAAWSFAPDRVPIHWNLQGEVDGYGSKAFGLLLTPLIAAGLYLLLLFIPRIDPGRSNLENSAKAYGAIRIALMVFLTALHIVCVSAALGAKVSMNLFMGLAMGALFIVLGNYMGKLRPNWFAGVRTPWTLSSQLSWTKTHRAAGPVFMAMGVGMLLLGFVPRGWMLATVLSLDFLAIIGLVVYSYLVWRRDPNRISPAGVTAAGGPIDAENVEER